MREERKAENETGKEVEIEGDTESDGEERKAENETGKEVEIEGDTESEGGEEGRE